MFLFRGSNFFTPDFPVLSDPLWCPESRSKPDLNLASSPDFLLSPFSGMVSSSEPCMMELLCRTRDHFLAFLQAKLTGPSFSLIRFCSYSLNIRQFSTLAQLVMLGEYEQNLIKEKE